MRTLKQSGTRPVFFLLVLTSDHITGATGLTPTVTISKDGAAFGAPAGTIAEIANGWYKLTPTSADTGTLGALLLHATGTGADPVDHIYQVVAYDPESATNLGLSNLDAAITSRMATYTQPTGFLAATFPGSVASPTNITAATGVVLSGVTHTGAVIPTVSVVTGLTASNLDVAVSTRMATYTQPTGFLAATFPSSVGTSTYAGGAVASVTAGVTVTTNNDKTGYALSAAGVQAVWDALTSALTTVGSVGKRIADFLTGDAFVRLGAPAGASVSADVAAVKVDTAATGTKASDIQARLPAALVSGRIDASVGAMAAGVITTAAHTVGAIDATVLASSAEQAIADKTLATAVEGTLTLKQALQVIAAATAGKVTGGGTTTITMRNTADSVNAIVATVDSVGNRSAVSYTFT